MSYRVKEQFNEPRDPEGRRIEILQPGWYERGALLQHPEEIGLQSLNGFWGIYETDGNCPLVLVSCTGIVSVLFPNKKVWRVLSQQWSFQGKEAWAQKYLQVWFPDNPNYPDDSKSHQLHRLVGRLHVNYTEDCLTEDGRGNLILMPGMQLDHIDTRKENNSWCNLAWVTGQQNQEMVGPEWPIERKRAWNDSRVFVDTPPEIRRTKFLS